MKRVVFSTSLLCLCFLLPLLLTACGQTSPATTEGLTLAWSPDGRWIVFPASTGMGPRELYVLNVEEALNGAGRESWIQLSQGFADAIDSENLDAIAYLWQAWSPDGRKIAFTAGDTIYTIDASCMEAPGTCVDTLTPVVGGASAWLTVEWSPDSRWLLVESTIAGPMVKTEKGVMASDLVFVMRVVAADGSGEVILSRETEPRQAPDWIGGPAFAPAWSPDGKRIVYCSGTPGKPDLYILTLEGETVVPLTDTPDLNEFSPIWSPDGRTIAYAVQSGEGYDLYTREIDSGDTTCVTCAVRPSWETSLFSPKWSPDGSQLAYVILGRRSLFQRFDPIYIYMIAPDGSDQIPVIEKGYSSLPYWSPDGTRLAFAFRPRPDLENINSDIYVINADGSGLTDLTGE